MQYYIGMDGGGTKTKCVLTDENLNVLHECSGGPSTFILIGVDTVCNTMFDLINECIEQAGITFDQIESAVIGTTGAGRRSDAETLEQGFTDFLKSKQLALKKFRVESDARIALEGAFGGNPGSILIAGTGSIMFGKDESGEIHRVGGFGRFIGDEGSGYMIGRKGLMAAAKSFDGRGAPTLLTGYIRDEFGIDDPSKLITEIYKNNFDIASAAPLVIRAAENNDEVCENIIDEESDNLMLHARAMKKKLQVPGMKVAPIGGTISTDNYYASKFREKVRKFLHEVEIIPAKYPPHIGAVIMAKNL